MLKLMEMETPRACPWYLYEILNNFIKIVKDYPAQQDTTDLPSSDIPPKLFLRYSPPSKPGVFCEGGINCQTINLH
jgi:hypothetical protein